MDEIRIGVCSVCQSQGRAYRVPVSPTEDEVEQCGEAAFFGMGHHTVGDTGIWCKEGLGSMPQALVKEG